MSEAPQKKILVADADEIVAIITSHILTRVGYSVDLARSAGDARERLAQHRYAAVAVSDQIAAELNGTLDHSRLILLGDSVRGLKAYVRLRKPLELDLLVTTVNACVHQP